MSSNDTMLKLDMNLLMSEISNIVNRHVSAAVMDFNTSKIQEDIAQCSDKIQQLESDLLCVTKDETTPRTRIQETTYRINVSLLEQEIISYREKLHGMKEELKRLRESTPNVEYASTNTNNIVLSIDEVIDTSSCDDNDVALLGNICKNNEIKVVKTNNIVDNKTINEEPTDEGPTDEGPTDDIDEILHEEEEEEEEEEGVFEIEIGGVSYYTTDEQNGSLYSIDVNGDPDVYVGKIQNGKAILNSN